MNPHLPGRIQLSNATKYDRYPELYKDVSRLAATLYDSPKTIIKILVFGCSTGHEPFTLAENYFTEDNHHIIGVDISQEAIDKARHENAHSRIKYHGPGYSLPELGPFDIIFANSVLCRWPHSKNRTNLSDLYPFSDFEKTLKNFDATLRSRGLICILNANYRFSDTSLFPNYVSMHLPSLTTAGFVKKFGDSGFVNKFDRHGDLVTDGYLFSCFLKI